MSWVTSTRANPRLRWMSAMSESSNSARSVLSKAVVGSSARMSSGLVGQRHGDQHPLLLPPGQGMWG